MTGTNNAGGSNTNTGINFGNVTAQTNNAFNGITFGTGFDNFITSPTISISGDGAITGATGIATTGNFAQSGAGTFSTGTGTVSLNGNTAVTGTLGVSSDFAINTNKFNVTASNGNTAIAGTLGVTGNTSLSTLSASGLATFNGGATVASGQTLTANGQSTFSPNGTNGVTVNTSSSNFLTLNGLTTATGSTLCTNGSNEVVQCSASSITLQSAYNGGNTINTTSGNNIAFTLSSGLATPTSFTLTNSGTAPAFIVNTPATGTQNAISVQQNSINTLTIDEAGDLATAGTIATTNTTASTNSSTGALTVSGGAGIGGALNVGTTLGVTGNTTLGGTLGVTGNSTLSTLSTSGLATLNSASVTNNETVGGTLGVTGVTTLSSTLGVTGLATFNGGATITSGQNLNLPGFNSGSVTFVNSSNQLAQDNSHLFWDQTNQGLGIGTNSVLPSAGLTVSKDSLGNATVAINQVGLGPIFTASSSGTTRFTIGNNGDLAATGAISGLTGYSQSSGNFAQSGAGTFSTGTGGVTLNGNTSVSGSNTFTVGTGATTLGGTLGVTGNSTLSTLSTSGLATLNSASVTNNETVGGTLGVTGLATFNGGATVASGQTLTANGQSTFSPNGTNGVTVNTSSSNFLTLNGLTTATGSTLCTNGSNEVVQCSASSITLQSAYNGGNTINTTSGNNIAFTLSSGLATPTSFTLTNSGTAPAFIVNTPATGTQNAISVQQNSINTLTIDEAGDLATAGTIATTNTTASTNSSTGALTVSGGAGIGGALNVGTTLGVTGNTTLGGTLGVTGNSTLSTLSTSGLATLNSASVTNNETVGGTLGVTGVTTLSSTLGVTGLATFNGGATITSGQNLNLPGFNSGSVTFVNSSNQLAQDNSHLFWDQTNQGLGIGTNSVLPSAGLTVSKDSLGIASVAFNLVGLVAFLTSSSSGTTRFTIGNNGDLAATGAISGLTGYSQSSGNFAQSGAGTFSTGTGGVTLNGNTSVSGSNTFTVGTGATTLGGTLGVTGNSTLSTLSTSGLATLNSASVTNNTKLLGVLLVLPALQHSMVVLLLRVAKH